MKTEKMNSDKAIDFLFDQTGKLRTTRVRHQAIVDALGIVKSELRDIKNEAIDEGRAAERFFQKNTQLSNDVKELKDKLKNEEDRAAAFVSRNIQLSNEVEGLKSKIEDHVSINHSLDRAAANIFKENAELRKEIAIVKNELEESKINVSKRNNLVNILKNRVKKFNPDYTKNSIL